MNEPKYPLSLTDEQFSLLEEAASLLVLKHQFIDSMEDAVARLADAYICINGALLSHSRHSERFNDDLDDIAQLSFSGTL